MNFSRLKYFYLFFVCNYHTNFMENKENENILEIKNKNTSTIAEMHSSNFLYLILFYILLLVIVILLIYILFCLVNSLLKKRKPKKKKKYLSIDQEIKSDVVQNNNNSEDKNNLSSHNHNEEDISQNNNEIKYTMKNAILFKYKNKVSAIVKSEENYGHEEYSNSLKSEDFEGKKNDKNHGHDDSYEDSEEGFNCNNLLKNINPILNTFRSPNINDLYNSQRLSNNNGSNLQDFNMSNTSVKKKKNFLKEDDLSNSSYENTSQLSSNTDKFKPQDLNLNKTSKNNSEYHKDIFYSHNSKHSLYNSQVPKSRTNLQYLNNTSIKNKESNLNEEDLSNSHVDSKYNNDVDKNLLIFSQTCDKDSFYSSMTNNNNINMGWIHTDHVLNNENTMEKSCIIINTADVDNFKSSIKKCTSYEKIDNIISKFAEGLKLNYKIIYCVNDNTNFMPENNGEKNSENKKNIYKLDYKYINPIKTTEPHKKLEHSEYRDGDVILYTDCDNDSFIEKTKIEKVIEILLKYNEKFFQALDEKKNLLMDKNTKRQLQEELINNKSKLDFIYSFYNCLSRYYKNTTFNKTENIEHIKHFNYYFEEYLNIRMSEDSNSFKESNTSINDSLSIEEKIILLDIIAMTILKISMEKFRLILNFFREMKKKQLKYSGDEDFICALYKQSSNYKDVLYNEYIFKIIEYFENYLLSYKKKPNELEKSIYLYDIEMISFFKYKSDSLFSIMWAFCPRDKEIIYRIIFDFEKPNDMDERKIRKIKNLIKDFNECEKIYNLKKKKEEVFNILDNKLNSLNLNEIEKNIYSEYLNIILNLYNNEIISPITSIKYKDFKEANNKVNKININLTELTKIVKEKRMIESIEHIKEMCSQYEKASLGVIFLRTTDINNKIPQMLSDMEYSYKDIEYIISIIENEEDLKLEIEKIKENINDFCDKKCEEIQKQRNIFTIYGDYREKLYFEKLHTTIEFHTILSHIINNIENELSPSENLKRKK